MIELEKSKKISTIWVSNYSQLDPSSASSLPRTQFINSKIYIGDESGNCKENVEATEYLYDGGFFEFNLPIQGRYICILRDQFRFNHDEIFEDSYVLYKVFAYESINLIQFAASITGPTGDDGYIIDNLVNNLRNRST